MSRQAWPTFKKTQRATAKFLEAYAADKSKSINEAVKDCAAILNTASRCLARFELGTHGGAHRLAFAFFPGMPPDV